MGAQKSIKKNFVLNALLTISGIIFPFISSPYVMRVLGPEGTGTVDFACSNLSYFSLLAQLGIPTYGVKACAQVRDNKLELARTVKELLVINLVMTTISYAFFIPTLFMVPQFANEKLLYIIISSTLLFNTIGMEYLYKGLEQYGYITIRSIVFKFIAFGALFLLVKTKDDYVIYGAISIFAASASFIMNFFHSRRLISFKNIGKCNYKKHIKPVLIYFAMSCTVTIYVNMDKSMLGFMTSEADVGYYGASVKIKTILVALVTSLGAVLLPRASYYVEHKMYDEFLRINGKALHFVFVVATPLTVFFMLFAREGILFVSGEEYLNAITPMAVIIPTLLFIGITNILGIQVLVPLGKEKYVLYSEIAGAITDLILNIILIPKLKATGAAIGTLAAEFVVLVVQYYLLYGMRKEVPILEHFKKIKYGNIILSLIVASPVCLWVKYVKISLFEGKVLLHSFVLLALAGMTFFGIYYVIMMLMKDKMMLEITDSVLGKLRKKKATT